MTDSLRFPFKLISAFFVLGKIWIMSQLTNSFYKTNLVLIFQNKPENLRWSLKNAGFKSDCLWNATRCDTKCENTFHLESRACMFMFTYEVFAEGLKLPKASVNDQAKRTRNTV